MASVGRISLNLDAGTSQFVLDMNKANHAVTQFGHAGVTNVQATSAALRVLEGNVTSNLRAAERFAASIPGVGAALQAAFPVVGGIALLGVLSELGKKSGELYDAFQKLKNAPAAISAGFNTLNATVATSNDQLRVTNDHLANDIAKLEGRPQNGLALALDEAKVAADRLAESIHKDAAELRKLLSEQSIGGLKGFFTGTAYTSDIQKAFGGTTGFGGFSADLNKITADGLEKIRSATTAKEKDAAQTALNAALVGQYGKQLAYVNSQLQIAQKLQADTAAQKQITTGFDRSGRALTTRADAPDQSARIAELQGLRANLNEQVDRVNLTDKNSQLAAQKDALEAARNNARTLRPEVDRASEAIARLRIEIAASKGEAAVAGNAFAEAIAKGAEQSGNEVLRLNQELQQRKLAAENEAKENPALKPQADALPGRLSAAQALTITALNTQLALNRAITQEKEKQLIGDKESANRSFEVETKGILGISTGLPGQKDPVTEREEERQNQIDKTIEKLRAETDILRYQTEAAGLGRDAQRAAGLAGVAARGREEAGTPNGDPSVIAAQLAQEKTRYDLEDAVSGRNDDFSTGFQKFFQKFSDNTQSAGNQVQTVLGGAFQGLDKQLDDLITGQKASFSSFFRGIAAEIANLTINNLVGNVAKGLLPQPGGGSAGGGAAAGGLGGILGSLLHGIGRRSGAGGVAGDAGALFGGGSSGTSGIFSFLDDPGAGFSPLQSLFGGFLADGGPLDNNKWYIAGEHGPEPVWGGGGNAFATGYGKMSGGGSTVYNVDARGSDNSAETELRMRRGLAEAHRQGARDGAAVSQERRRRVPNSKAFAS